MSVPKKTGEIFEMLSKGQFICSNSCDANIRKLFDIIDEKENYESLSDYFLSINFVLEKGDEFYYFSRIEKKADLERKLEIAFRWIDIVDFFKSFESSFASGYSFTPAEIEVKISVNAVVKNKADSIRNMLKLDEKSSYQDIITRAIESLVRDGFVEMETEILKSYKVLSSFKYLEELISNINIPEGVQYEIPE